MLLLDCDVQEYVKEHMTSFLKQTPLTFDDLKFNLTSKAPIPTVHQECVNYFQNLNAQSQEQITKKLSEQAYKTQQMEDESTRKRLNQEELEDKIQQRLLDKSCKSIRYQIAQYRIQSDTLQLQLLHKVTSAIHPGSSTQTETTSETINTSLLKVRAKIKNQEMLLDSKNKELNLISTREGKRIQLREQISQREMAKIAYDASGLGGMDTLSHANRLKLNKTITDQKALLDQRCDELIKQAELINYGLYMALLSKHLYELNLSDAERAALRTCSKLMEKHIQAQTECGTIEESLKLKAKSISSQIIKLRDYIKNQEQFKQNKPHLEESNAQLLVNNQELNLELEFNTTRRGQLSSAALFVLTLSFLCSIPLILTYAGAIPFFLTPVLMYLLMSSLPVLSLLTTIALGIATWIFHNKAQSNAVTMELNVATIKNNLLMIKKNTETFQNLEKTTLPSLQKQLKSTENLRDAQLAVLQAKKKYAAELLNQAQEVKPQSYAVSLVLTSEADSAEFVDANDEDAESLTFARAASPTTV